MSALFGLLGLLGIIISVILFIFKAIFKRGLANRKNGILMVISIVFFIIGLSLPSQSKSNDKNSNPSSVTKKNETLLSKDEFEQMYTDPSKFKDRKVDFYAKIFVAPEKDDKGTYLQVYADNANNKNTIIGINDPKLDVKQNDIIHVVGSVQKKFEGKNAFGGTVTAPTILAEKIEKTDYITAFSPSKKTIEINKEQNQSGYVIKLKKVEIAQKETRVFISVTNNTKENINFYTFNTKVAQGSKQIKEQTNYEADYPKMESELLPGITEEGILVFSPVDENGENLKIVLEGSSSNYKVKINPFTYEISLK